MLQKLVILLAVVLVLSVPLSAADTPDSSDQSIQVGSYPQITIQGKDNTTFNVTYYGIAVSIPVAGLNAVSRFEDQSWQMTSTSQDSVSYKASMNLGDLIGQEKLPKMLDGHGNMNITVYVNFSKYSGNSSSVSIYNYSGLGGNVTFPSLRNNTIEINSSIVTHFSVPFLVKIFLLQKISGLDRISNKTMVFTQFITKLHERSTSGMGIAFGYRAGLEKALGLYWWGQNYTINNSPQQLNTTLLIKNGNPYLMFGYNLPANRTGKVDQDPFFTAVGASFSKVPLVKAVATVENYILQNSEYFAAGLMVGTILIGIAYAGHRRRL